MFRFVFVELLLVCSSVFIDTVMVLQVHLKEMFFDLGANGGGISSLLLGEWAHFTVLKGL